MAARRQGVQRKRNGESGIQQRGVQDRTKLKLFVRAIGRADDGKDAGADDRTILMRSGSTIQETFLTGFFSIFPNPDSS